MFKFQFLITFLSVVILDVDIGLYIGVGYYVLVNLVRQTKPDAVVLGNIPGTEIYKDVKLYKDAKEFAGIRIIRMQESLHASNAAFFKKKIYEFTNTKPQEYISKKMKLTRKKQRESRNDIPLILKIAPKLIQKLFPFWSEHYKPKPAPIGDKKSSDQVNKLNNSKVNNIPANVLNESIEEKKDTDELKNFKKVYRVRFTLPGENDVHEEKPSEGQSEQEETENAKDIDTVESNKAAEKNDENDISSDEDDYSVLPKPPYHHIVIDCSCLNYIDTFGVKSLNQLIFEYRELQVNVFLAECNDAIMSRFCAMQNAFESQDYIPNKCLHVTTHDAVHHALQHDRKQLENL